MGATCDKDGHSKFNEFFRDLTSGKNEDHEVPSAVGKIECPIPPEGVVYDYLFEQKGRGKWTLWLDLIKDKGIDPNIKRLSEIIVPTMETARYMCYIQLTSMVSHMELAEENFPRQYYYIWQMNHSVTYGANKSNFPRQYLANVLFY